ncbi:MAG TPA: hypothetical protein ENI04_00300 [Candidatus Wildermuthbacteria bacterium]|nr:hypothetical protein [Candidatus Wildermuthbacteria bacterium]
MKIHRLKDQEKAKAAAQKALSALFAKHKNTPILFLCSGGSALELLDGLFLSGRKDLITLGMLDERYSEKEGINNFLQLTKTKFFFDMLTGGTMLIDTSIQDKESLSDISERFSASLRGWRTINSNGIIIATIGIAQDGHTAGIMPKMAEEEFGDLFENDEVWAVGYDTGRRGDQRERVTVTLPFLRTIDYAVAYVVGWQKERALSRVMEKEGSLREIPARIIREMKDVSVFTDIA